MTRRRRVGLVFGGRSVEHEVSVTSARGVAAAIGEAGLDCVPIGVTGEGRWLGPALSQKVLDSDRPRVEPLPDEDDGVCLAAKPGSGGLLAIDREGRGTAISVDVVFPLIHGWGGEDGRIQGALDLTGLPCVGSGVAASALAMDKIHSRTILEARGIPGVAWIVLAAEDRHGEGASWSGRIGSRLGYPVFVKPANGGSSVGISRVVDANGLPAALDEAFACDRRVIVERAVDAREIECAVLGNARPEASVLGEIVPSGEFYDYAAKYLDGKSELIVPAHLAPRTEAAIREHAVSAFRALDLAGFARVDFLLDRNDGRIFLNEVNTLPGFTPISMFPKLWEASGLAYGRLVERLVELALERWQGDNRRRVKL